MFIEFLNKVIKFLVCCFVKILVGIINVDW